ARRRTATRTRSDAAWRLAGLHRTRRAESAFATNRRREQLEPHARREPSWRSEELDPPRQLPGHPDAGSDSFSRREVARRVLVDAAACASEPRHPPGPPEAGPASFSRREVARRGVVEAAASIDDFADESALCAPDADVFHAASVFDGVGDDLGRGGEPVEHLRFGHAFVDQLACQPLAELLDVAAKADRSKVRKSRRLGWDCMQDTVGVRIVLAGG